MNAHPFSVMQEYLNLYLLRAVLIILLMASLHLKKYHAMATQFELKMLLSPHKLYHILCIKMYHSVTQFFHLVPWVATVKKGAIGANYISSRMIISIYRVPGYGIIYMISCHVLGSMFILPMEVKCLMSSNLL